jgi:DNA-binding YbaB/EbfC family protein
MFGNMFELGSIMKQAKEFGGKFQEVQDQLSQIKSEGSAAGGMVVVEVNGCQTMLSCKIDPALFQKGDAELLEELIIVATNNAIEESQIKQKEAISSLAANTDLAALGESLGKFMAK